MKVLLQSVRQSNKGPEIIVSRADKLLVKRLFEMEVPEIYSGAVEIVAMAREPGSRSKVAVWAKQDGVDAVGSCVGLRGIRIQNIVNELQGEKIDVVQWNKDPAVFIASALSPSLVMRVDMDEAAASAIAIVPDRQLSLAIGKEGQNARLAARLTGWKVDIKSNIEADATAKAEPAAEEAAPTSATAVIEEAEAVVKAVEQPPQPQVVPEPEEAPVTEAPAEETPIVAETTEVAAEVPQSAEVPAEPAIGEPIPEEQILPEPLEVPAREPVPVAEASASIQDLPENVWAIRGGRGPESGVIRFAEDIEELKAGVGGRRGRRGGSRRGGQGARGRRTNASRRR
jgi:N utilization substance protein A